MKCHVVRNLPINGLDIYLIDEPVGSGNFRVAGLVDGRVEWRDHPPDVMAQPTISLDGRASEAFVEGVLAWSRSADGYVPTDARKDYLDERRRVDRLQEALITIATGAGQ